MNSTQTKPLKRRKADISWGERMYHGWYLARSERSITLPTLRALGISTVIRPKSPQILIGTHHKVFTVFMSRVFKSYAKITRRSISVGTGDEIDYGSDIIVDHHSQFDFSRVDHNYVGMHFRRDPRDLLISAGFYHKRSKEPQLHIASKQFGGKTYQEYVNSMETMQDVFLFELENSAGYNIQQMGEWDYNRGFLELTYEDLVHPEGGKRFRKAIDSWPLPTLDKNLLEHLFNYYSLFNPRAQKNQHARDPRSRQFEDHFNDELQQAFDKRFAGLPKKLGYE